MSSPEGMTVPLLNNARASTEQVFVLHEYYLFPLGLLINELGGVLETAHRWRREGAERVDGNVLEGAQNSIVDLLRICLLYTSPSPRD